MNKTAIATPEFYVLCNAIKKLRGSETKKEAAALLPKVVAMLDKLAKKSVIHKNKAANLKSKLTKKVNAIAK